MSERWSLVAPTHSPMQVRIPDQVSGESRIFVVVDYDNQIEEFLFESDNQRISGPIAVTDGTGPSVVSHAPTLVRATPLSQVIFEFDESIDLSSFTEDDIVEFVGPGGIDLRQQVTGIGGENRRFIVSFADQYRPGQYRLTIGPDIRDIVGTPMDQNGDRNTGTPEDTYTAFVTLDRDHLPR